MSDQNQGALVHEMLGRFIEEAVGKAVREQRSEERRVGKECRL